MASKRNKNLMKRTARVYLNELNTGKAQVVRQFLYQCHDVMQYFVDLFWQRKDFSGHLGDLPTIHQARNKFGITTRLGQVLAKQACGEHPSLADIREQAKYRLLKGQSRSSQRRDRQQEKSCPHKQSPKGFLQEHVGIVKDAIANKKSLDHNGGNPGADLKEPAPH